MKTSSRDYFGVPKDSKLEPDSGVAKGNGRRSQTAYVDYQILLFTRSQVRGNHPIIDWNQRKLRLPKNIPSQNRISFALVVIVHLLLQANG